MDDKVMDDELEQISRGWGLSRYGLVMHIAKELQAFRRQAQEAPKAASQSAEELENLACFTCCGAEGTRECSHPVGCEGMISNMKAIDSAFAAQRQAGREEAANNFCKHKCAWPPNEWEHPDECECADRADILEAKPDAGKGE